MEPEKEGEDAVREGDIAQVGEGPLGRVADRDLAGVEPAPVVVEVIPAVGTPGAVGGSPSGTYSQSGRQGFIA